MKPEDPDWPRASAWLEAGRGQRDGRWSGEGGGVGVLGVPLSVTSISHSGADRTPDAVRAALRRFSTWCAPLEVDVLDVPVRDLGDVPLDGLDAEAALAAVEEAIRSDDVAEVDLLVLLGGDNAITRPGVRARSAAAGDGLGGIGLLTLDAHHDVRGFHAGPTNGTPVRGLLGDGLDGRNVVQIGIGSFTNARAHRRWAEDRGITAVGVDAAREEGVATCVRRHLDGLAERCSMVWVDLDVDVLDAAFAPGCPGARPGGLDPAELAAAARAAGAHPAVTGVDVVEVDATADRTGATVDVAALCLLSTAAGYGARGRSGP